MESIIGLSEAAHLKGKHKSFFCPEPLSVLIPLTVGVKQLGRGGMEKGLARAFLLTGNPLLVLHSLGRGGGGAGDSLCKRKCLQMIS